MQSPLTAIKINKLTTFLPEKNTTRQTGEHYENLAFTFLCNQGLQAVDRNFSHRQGEIDIIMQDKHHLVFIEVRYRSHSRFGTAIDSITSAKQKKIFQAAQYFLNLNHHFQHHDCRFDVVTIDKNNNGEIQLDWIKNAFME